MTKELWTLLVYLYERLRFNYNCMIARQASRMNNNRKYYVIKLKGKYRVYCREDFNGMKREGIVLKKLTFIDLQNLCCYQTK